MSGPSRLHQGGSEFASTVTGHNVDLGNKSLTRRDTAQTINNHNYYGYSTVQLRDQAHEDRGEKRKCPDDQEQASHSQPPIEALLQSLRFNQIDARHDNIKKAHRKTCKWIIKRAEFLDWLDPNKVDEHHGFLWIKGKPGAGKSTLMKFILSNARRSMKDKIIISFFFNARGEQLEKSTTGMYRSLLLQILQLLPTLHSALDPALVLGISENHDWSVEALRALFEQAVEGLGNSCVVVFIDALDECNESEIRFMVSSFKSLGNLSAAKGISFQVCLASRHYPHITMPKKIELVLEGQEGHEQDIISYLDSELEIGDSKLAHEVRDLIKEKASGVFMWVVLVAGILQQKYDQGRIHTLKQTLREIPGDLHELFRDILTRDDANKDGLLLCIQWVLFARSPLKSEQLYFAIRSHTECTTCKWDRDEIGQFDIGNFILSSSKGLAEVTRVKKDPTVQFIHESVRDFLLKDGGLRVILDTGGDIGAVSHDDLKGCCHKYMESYMKENGSPESDSKHHLSEARAVADLEFPFLRYAVQNILYHANAAEEGQISQTKFLETFQVEKWIQHNNVFQDKDVRRHTTGASLLYLLAEYNLGCLIESHQGSQSCFDIEGERYGAPILAAMATGSRLTVWRLLKRETRDNQATSHLQSLCNEYDVEREVKHKIGRNFKFKRDLGLIYYLLHEDDLIAASVAVASSKPYTHIDFRMGSRESLFSFAFHHSHDIFATLQFLLDNGADIEARDKLGRTPIALAAAEGNMAAITLLLEKGANIEKTYLRGETLFSVAIQHSHDVCSSFRSLIEGGADIEAKDKLGRTPLALAAENGDMAAVTFLLEQGASVEGACIRGENLFSFAIRHSHDVCSTLRWLIESGADIEARDKLGRTLLALAAADDNTAAVTFLLEKGVNFEGACIHGKTPLMHAADQGNEKCMRLLISEGASVAVVNKEGRTPLCLAAQRGAAALVVLLLNKGANVHHTDHNGNTALFHATLEGSEECMRLLISAGASVAATDNQGQTALFGAACSLKESEAKMHLLISQGLNVSAVDNNGNTALAWLLREGRATETLVEMLLNRDTLDRPESLGRTPLMFALNNSPSIMKQLINRGANIDSIDKQGQSALFLAIRLKLEGHTRLLIDSGACIDVSDTRNHRTALSYAVTSRFCDKHIAPQGQQVMESANHGEYLPPSIAERLLIRGAAVDGHDINGRTPLSYAAGVSVSADLVSLLLSHGADVDRTDNNGRTPLSYAATNHGLDAENCLRLLLDGGAILDKIDKAGKTALSYAVTDGIRDLLSNYPQTLL